LQYLIASILLFVFYKKFIANNAVMLLDGDTGTKGGKEGSDSELYDYAADNFDGMNAQTQLKAKIKSQILNNIEGLDPEELAKYDVLIEEIDHVVSNNPEDIAKMIEMLLAEGDTKFKSGNKGS
ncbi:MAG: flagellar M-ring protein FliF, partial [Campylobacterota bacterium]|nr:flagellar M-ring protein FliF [Campylobacterota bacterium]